jgi:hypothetical protein
MVHEMEPPPEEQAILSRASDVGFSLTQYETDIGQLVWEWRHGDEPGPQFIRRSIAIDWMHNRLTHDSSPASPRLN